MDHGISELRALTRVCTQVHAARALGSSLEVWRCPVGPGLVPPALGHNSACGSMMAMHPCPSPNDGNPIVSLSTVSLTASLGTSVFVQGRLLGKHSLLEGGLHVSA